METTPVSYLDSLVQKRQEAAARMREIITTAETENRDITAEEQANLDKFDADYDRFTAEEKRHKDLAAKLEVTDALHEQVARTIVERRSPSPVKTDSENLIALLKGDIRSFDSHRTIPVGSNRAIVQEIRALQSAGGSAIETTFADFVTVFERTLNPMMEIANVIPTRTGSPIVLPRLTGDVTSSGTVTAEAAGITEGDPTISSVTLNAYKRAFTTLYSSELDQDEIIGLDKLLANAITRHIGLAWGTAFTTGNDSSEANGFITAGTNGGTAAGTAGNQATDLFFAASDLVDLFYGLAAPYRQNASWVVANTALAKMRKFRDSTGQFLWSPALQAGQPDAFLNRPVYENPAMAAVASATKSIAVGDFSAYVIRDVQPLRIDLSSEYKFNTDQLALRVVTRRDGDLPDVLAIRYLVSANT